MVVNMLATKKPVQGFWGLVEKMLAKYGALNKKYDSDLDGKIDLSSIPLLPSSQLGFSFAWEKVAEITETGVSSVEFTGLAGDADKIYLLILHVYNPSTSQLGIYTRFNGDTTITNYGYIAWTNAAGTVSTTYKTASSTSGIAGAIIGGLSATSAGTFLALITNGTQYVLSATFGFNTNPPRFDNYGGVWIKQAEVTSITLFTGTSTAIDWTAYLFKPKW